MKEATMNRTVTTSAESTPRRRDILRALVALQAAEQKVTLRGIADRVGLKAASSVHHQLQVLLAAGHVTATPINGNQPRTRYAITDTGRAELSATSRHARHAPAGRRSSGTTGVPAATHHPSGNP
jgi:predicted ArsR family transcriptional regulator